MFTGIVTALGRIAAIEDGPVRRITVDSPYAAHSFSLGCSVSHDGACLTLVSVEPQEQGARHVVEVSPETLARTTLGAWAVGTDVNLERALKVGDELGGHIVQGHVDGVGEVRAREDVDGWMRLRIAAPDALAAFIAEKGSIAVDGVSLTVNAVEENLFDLMIIPHTAAVTTLGRLQPGAHVNLEVDVMARYAARLIDFRPAGTPS
ncbi:riboflavin synthase [Alkalicaulis satelles]|uniref:Riboflavin synthase n=1 Tax=Alkalicaulis satelles TaxID=2609175 RepID=A0A5M6ZJU1_9PROT|nr:riboflavin synthase [Alkalicaulis satelles]KAA5805083.1 riboflavin synthase [Alkalicaulis satelles]